MPPPIVCLSLFAMPPREAVSLECPVQHYRVLCVEDHEQVAELIRLILRRAGHEADWACDGVVALHHIDSSPQPYDIVITDHVMPDLDGLGLVRALRSRNFAGEVIVQSARLSPAEKSQYDALGVTRFMEKPIRPESLRALLNSLRSTSAVHA